MSSQQAVQLSPYLIRREFVIQYYERQEKDHRLSWQMIEDRDAKHRELNRRYGIFEPNGQVPIGKRSHQDPQYAKQYDAIQAEFKPRYDSVLQANISGGAKTT